VTKTKKKAPAKRAEVRTSSLAKKKVPEKKKAIKKVAKKTGKKFSHAEGSVTDEKPKPKKGAKKKATKNKPKPYKLRKGEDIMTPFPQGEGSVTDGQGKTQPPPGKTGR